VATACIRVGPVGGHLGGKSALVVQHRFGLRLLIERVESFIENEQAPRFFHGIALVAIQNATIGRLICKSND